MLHSLSHTNTRHQHFARTLSFPPFLPPSLPSPPPPPLPNHPPPPFFPASLPHPLARCLPQSHTHRGQTARDGPMQTGNETGQMTGPADRDGERGNRTDPSRLPLFPHPSGGTERPPYRGRKNLREGLVAVGARCETKVSQLHLPLLGYENVEWFHVAVNEVALVYVVQCLDYFAQPADHGSLLQSAGAEPQPISATEGALQFSRGGQL